MLILLKNWKILLAFCLILTVLGFVYYDKALKKGIYTDAEGIKVLKNFSLGEQGDKPFYQTEKDFQLIHDFAQQTSNLGLQTLASNYKKSMSFIAMDDLESQNVRLSTRQYPKVFEMVTDACTILEVPVPQVYGVSGKNFNLKVEDFENPVLLINLKFASKLEPEALRYLIAREIGHLKMKHIFYRDLMNIFRGVGKTLLPDILLEWSGTTTGVQLLEWYRESEVSADRAGLTVTGNIELALKTLIRLKMGNILNTSEYGDINVEAYIQQLQVLEQSSRQGIGVLRSEMQNAHPFMPYRIKNLHEFYTKNDFLFQ